MKKLAAWVKGKAGRTAASLRLFGRALAKAQKRAVLSKGTAYFDEGGELKIMPGSYRRARMEFTASLVERFRNARVFWEVKPENEVDVWVENGNYRTVAEQAGHLISLVGAAREMGQSVGARRIVFRDVELGPSHFKDIAGFKLEREHYLREDGMPFFAITSFLRRKVVYEPGGRTTKFYDYSLDL